MQPTKKANFYQSVSSCGVLGVRCTVTTGSTASLPRGAPSSQCTLWWPFCAKLRVSKIHDAVHLVLAGSLCHTLQSQECQYSLLQSEQYSMFGGKKHRLYMYEPVRGQSVCRKRDGNHNTGGVASFPLLLRCSSVRV